MFHPVCLSFIEGAVTMFMFLVAAVIALILIAETKKREQLEIQLRSLQQQSVAATRAGQQDQYIQ